VTVPRVVLLTDRHAASAAGHDLVTVVGAAVEAGIDAVIVRERDLPDAERVRLVDQIAARLAAGGATTIVAGPATRPGQAVHLRAVDPMPDEPAPLLGRSCHDATELARAAADGCHYATLSPIFESTSKPGYGPPLGAAALAHAPLPVLALGGVDAGNAAACLRAGAHGVAVMGAVMGASDPAAVVGELIESVNRSGVRR
jgi:thiamine-phosphate pyrophosphorylase